MKKLINTVDGIVEDMIGGYVAAYGDIVDRLADTRQALCIVNSRFHAQSLHDAIRHLEGARHLSTLMCAAHRRAVLAEIRDDLAQGRPCRVISTSLIDSETNGVVSYGVA